HLAVELERPFQAALRHVGVPLRVGGERIVARLHRVIGRGGQDERQQGERDQQAEGGGNAVCGHARLLAGSGKGSVIGATDAASGVGLRERIVKRGGALVAGSVRIPVARQRRGRCCGSWQRAGVWKRGS